MSHDLSRQLYAHIGCNALPCTCTWEHPPLAILAVHCWSCTRSFATVTEMSNHHLAAHERPAPGSATSPGCDRPEGR